MSSCDDLSNIILISQMNRQILTLRPQLGFLGIECGVGGTYIFVMLEKNAMVGEFSVEIGVPAAGDNTFRMRWTRQPPGVTAVLTHRGKGGTENAHVHHILLNICGYERMVYNTADVIFRTLTSQPIPQLNGSATHRRLEFPGRINTAQQFTLLSFPGMYESEWVKITHMEMVMPKESQLSVACVFFPEGSSLDGQHMQPCMCQELYRDTHPDAHTWPGGQAPWGCEWFGRWMDQVGEMECAGHTGVVVFKRGLKGDRQRGLGHSQKGEVRYAMRLGINVVEVEIDEFMQGVLPKARSRESLDGYVDPVVSYRCQLHADHDTLCGRDAEVRPMVDYDDCVFHAKRNNYSGFAFRDGTVWYKNGSAMELLDDLHPAHGCQVGILLI